MSRLSPLQAALALTLLLPAAALSADPTPSLRDRIAGLLYGAAIGDALGGPIEFQTREDIARLPRPPKAWKEGERLDAAAIAASRRRLHLRPYAPLRAVSSSYGQWGQPAPPGTVTDDTRHKLILLEALHREEPLTLETLAQTYLSWPSRPLPEEWKPLVTDWLEEWRFAGAWILGERGTAVARPPERMWQGLPTCCGQMTSLPLAGLFPGEPTAAYRACYQLSFFDNGWGKDLNAALVAGLASALTGPHEAESAWPQIFASLRETDPYHYGAIRYTTRQVDRWLDLALRLAREAEGQPARLFARLEEVFAQTIKWEAQVPVVVAFSCLALAEYDPLAALQLSMEWGHDTDSYAQLLGAFIGAIHGLELFPAQLREPVHTRLVADFGVDLQEEATFLAERAHKSRGVPFEP